MIIFFTKAPEKGKTKTRLKPFLNDEETAEISKELIKSLFNEIKKSKISYKIYYSGDKEELSFLEGEFIPQRGVCLGERMRNAIFDELKHSSKVILIGSDVVGLSSEVLRKVDNKLDENEIAIGPTLDGGYGLIAMTKEFDVFSDIKYSREDVFFKTLEKARSFTDKIYLTEKFLDVDEYIDLVRLETNTNDVKILGYGEYNLNFLVDSYVLRVNISSQIGLLNDQLRYEYDALKFLQKSGVTPVPLSYKEDSKWLKKPYLTMEFYDGRPLNYKTDLKIAAKLLSKVHNLDVEGGNFIRVESPFRAMYEEFVKMFKVYKEYEKKDLEVESRIEELFRILKTSDMYEKVERPSIINTELNSGNFIIGDKSLIIDWEKPIIGECEQDLAHFLVPTTTYWKTDTILSEAEMENFLDIYEKYRKIDRRKFYKYLMYNSLRGITWCSMAYVEYEKNRALKNEFTKKKIDEYLSLEFLDMIKKFYKEDL